MLRSVLAFASCYIGVLFFFLTRKKASSNLLEYFLEHFIVSAAICLIPVVVIVIFVLRKAKKWRVVGFQFNVERIELIVKKNKLNSLRKVVLSKSNLKVFSKKENAFLGIGGIRFFAFQNKADQEIYWFNYDHYIWEKQRKEKVFFRNYLLKEWRVEIPEKPKQLEPENFINHY